MDKELKELIVVKGKVIEQQRGYSASAGKQISYEQGAKMVKRHYDENPDDVVAHFIGRNCIEQILTQSGCIGIRVFSGFNELGIKQLILVGVDAQGRNILQVENPNPTNGLDKKQGAIFTEFGACPPYCGGVVGDQDDSSSSWW